MAEPVLAIRNLSLDYRMGGGAIHALRDVSFSANAGEIVGIVGESGCGKTTLAMAIPGLLPSAAQIVNGSISFKGEALDLQAQESLRGREIAMVFQDPATAFNPVLTIGAQLVDFQHKCGGSRAEKRARATVMLANTGISSPEIRMRNYPHELSGGMRQRVAIAAALLVNPALLIADEPTTALDVTTEAQILHLLRGLKRSYGGAIVIVTHHLGVVAEICDRVVVMYAGEVVEEGPVADVFANPGHPYTAALLACDPARISQQGGELPVIAGGLPDLAHIPDGCIFASRCHRKVEACEFGHPPDIKISDGHRALCREVRP